MITKNGLLRPSRNSSLISSTKPKPSKPSKMEPNEADVDFSNIPTIQGTYQATKLNATAGTRGSTKIETRVGSGAISIKKDSRNSTTTIPKIIETSLKNDENITAEPAIPKTITANPESEINMTDTTEVTSTVKIFKDNDLYKDFRKPDFETSPWKPIIPDFVNTELKLLPTEIHHTTFSSPATTLKPPKTIHEIPEKTTESPEPEVTRFSLNPPGFGSFDSSEPDFPRDRIVPQDMINFRPNSKFKNKIPVPEEPANPPMQQQPEIEISGHLPPETYNLHLGASSGSVRTPIYPGSSKIDITTSSNLASSAQSTIQPNLATDTWTSKPEVSEISGIGVAEPVFDLEIDLESRNRYSGILALGPVEDKPTRDRKVEPVTSPKESSSQSQEPIYTSYRTPDLNGGAKPSLVENPGTLKPFRHTIPVDKITPALQESPEKPVEKTTVPEVVEKIPIFISSDESSSLIDSTSKNKNSDGSSESSEKERDKIEISEEFVGIGSGPVDPEEKIDEETILTHSTTEEYSEVLHPSYNNGEKLMAVPETSTPATPEESTSSILESSRNSTFVEVDTVVHTPVDVKPQTELPEEEIWQSSDVDVVTEIGKKVYNDTLKAYVVENVATLAPAKSNTGVGRPLRPRPKIDKEKATRILQKIPESSTEVLREDSELVKKLFGSQGKADDETTGSTENGTDVKTIPILKEPIVEVVTSISTKVSTKVKTDHVVLRFEITNSTSPAEIRRPGNSGSGFKSVGKELEENRSFRDGGSEGNGEMSEKLVSWTEERPPLVAADLVGHQAYDRKISVDEEKSILEKLRKFAEVRTKGETGKKPVRNLTSIIEHTQKEVPLKSQIFGDFEKLKKFADVGTGNVPALIANATQSFTLSRDGVQVFTKVLHKAEILEETTGLTTDANEDFTTIGKLEGFFFDKPFFMRFFLVLLESCNGFTCDDGRCLPPENHCNMLGECSNAEDEANCTCADFLKAQQLHQKICDGTADCWDYSDEIDCGKISKELF